MGTSASGGGAGNSNPLIPSWILSGGNPPQHNDENNDIDSDTSNNEGGNENPESQSGGGLAIPQHSSQEALHPTRYTAPKKQFNKFVSSGGSNRSAFRRAIRQYSRHAAGSTTGLARRMAPSAVRVAGFANTFEGIRTIGLDNTLRSLNLSEYIGKPVIDILSALTDVIFSDDESIFHDTQDDSLTKQAYTNAIVRICEIENIDLGTLTSENVEVMTATFIEETIVQRLFTDIGSDITKKEANIDRLIEIENIAYQIVNGLVRNQIMPEIRAMQLGGKTALIKGIENVYRIAFDVLSTLQD